MIDTKKHKYTAVGFTYLIGLICASFMGKILCLAAFLVLGAVFAVMVYLKRKVSLLYGVLAAAFLISGLYQAAVIDKSYELDGKTVYVTGKVTEKRTPDNDTVMLSVSGTAEGVPVKFTLFAPDTGIEAGDKVELTALFSKFTDRQYFPEASYYYSKGVFLKAYARSEISFEKGIAGPAVIMAGVSDYFKSRLDGIFSGESGGIIKAMFFGDKSDLSPRLSVNIKRSGVAHLTAVSGMHLSLMAHVAVSIINALFGKKRVLASVFAVCYIILTMLFFGMTVSVMRSGIMLLFYYGGAFFARKTKTLNSVDKALFLILVISPCACRDVGLWLSVLGTIGVSEVSVAVNRRFGIKKRNIIKSMIVSSLCASLCTAPIGMFCFGGISLMSALTGILLQPFFTVILVFVPVGILIPFIFAPLLYVSGYAADIMNFIINIIGGFRYSHIEAETDMVLYLFISVLLCGGGVYILTKRKNSAAYASVSVFLAAISAVCVTETIKHDNIELSVFSDGTNAVMRVEDKGGASVFAISDSGKTEKMIYEYSAGKNLRFVCIAAHTDNNNEIDSYSYNCSAHLPEKGNMLYETGEYSVYVADGAVFLNIRGVSVAMTDLENTTEADIAVRLGYGKDFDNYGNFATVLCDKKFYNYNNAVNACYEKAEFIIDADGRLALAD